MNHKEDKTLSEFFHLCSKKSTSLYQDFIYILTEKQKKNHAALVSGLELLSEDDQKVLNNWQRKKEEDYPIQYFINSVEFCGLDFYVEEGALIPRMETEEVVLFALKKIKNERIEVKNILDVGSGTGCMGISAAHKLNEKLEKTFLVEPSPEALKSLTKNIEKFKPAGVQIFNDSFESLSFEESFELILSNPPYIKPGDSNVQNSVYKFEPHLALYGGEDPIKLIVHWVNQAYDLLSDKGLMVFEFSHDQKKYLQEELINFKPEFHKDSFGKDRFFSISKAGV